MRKLKIESAANPTFKRLTSLLTSKGIKKEGEFLLSGKRLVEEFLQAKNQRRWQEIPPLSLIKTPAMEEIPVPPLLDLSLIELSESLFAELDELGTHAPLLLLKTPTIPERPLQQGPKGLELVCPVGDPQNLGAIARSARAFGVQTLLLTNESASPFLPKSLKASAGSLLDLKIERLLDLKAVLQAWETGPFREQCFALDVNGAALRTARLPKDLYLLCGEEGPGVPKNSRIQRLTIPTEGVESLNAAVATAIAVFEIKSR